MMAAMVVLRRRYLDLGDDRAVEMIGAALESTWQARENISELLMTCPGGDPNRPALKSIHDQFPPIRGRH